MRNLLAAATLCLGLATPALASVELSPEQLDSVTAGVTMTLHFTPATVSQIATWATTLRDQGWSAIYQGDTLTATIGPHLPTFTIWTFNGWSVNQ